MAEAIKRDYQDILKTNRLNIEITNKDDTLITFQAMDRDNGTYIGHASLMVTTRCFGQIGELSYELDERYRGQCYATEILRGAIAYIYAELGLVSLYGIAPEKNLAAQYVLQRIGFALNEELDGFIRYQAWNPKFETTQNI